MQHEFANGRILRLMRGDITQVEVDAICNAANSALRGGGGVDGAIHRAGGPVLMRELDRIRAQQTLCHTGSAVATSAGDLPAQYVFHAVGPVYQGGHGNEEDLLASCYRTCLELAQERKLKRISFPSISTGVYGYPVDQAAPIALGTVWDWLEQLDTTVEEAIFVLFDGRTLAAYETALRGRARAAAGRW